jgi:hypothetical protein
MCRSFIVLHGWRLHKESATIPGVQQWPASKAGAVCGPRELPVDQRAIRVPVGASLSSHRLTSALS